MYVSKTGERHFVTEDDETEKFNKNEVPSLTSHAKGDGNNISLESQTHQHCNTHNVQAKKRSKVIIAMLRGRYK